mmetsp:Transcript_58014/g.155356  ORF Transcript_58014/g.155356 Transcript_58014/m.155356 type:complete len:202 (-) Transcript_58014:281-886(-)
MACLCPSLPSPALKPSGSPMLALMHRTGPSATSAWASPRTWPSSPSRAPPPRGRPAPGTAWSPSRSYVPPTASPGVGWRTATLLTGSAQGSPWARPSARTSSPESTWRSLRSRPTRRGGPGASATSTMRGGRTCARPSCPASWCASSPDRARSSSLARQTPQGSVAPMTSSGAGLSSLARVSAARARPLGMAAARGRTRGR